jgi:diamine N-acetyltransferase
VPRTAWTNMTAPLIRHASTDDIDLLCHLGATTFRETYRPISDAAELEDYVGRQFTPPKVQAWLRDPRARTLLAFAAGAPAGYAHVRAAPVPECVPDREAIELSRLYLLASAQGTGLGGALMDAALAQVVSLGGRTVWLGAYDRNLKALEFYARRGFARAGTHEFEFGGQIHADPVLIRAVTVAA